MPLHIHCAFIRICVINTRRACEERDAEGVVPYKRDRIVFAVAEPCCCRGFRGLAVIYSIFKLRTRCRKCFSVRSETSPRPHLFTLTECFLIHCYLAGYSICVNTLGIWLLYGAVIPLYLSRKRGGLLHKKCNN